MSDSSAPRILGTLHLAGGEGRIRIEDVLAATPVEVWAALTDPRRLADWLGVVEGDLRVGGEYHGRWRVSGWDGRGRILTCEPPRRLELSSREDDGEREHRLGVALEPVGSGSRLVVEERGMPPQQLAAYGAGTQVHVEDLEAHLAGRPERHAIGRWDELFPGYEALPVIEETPSSRPGAPLGERP